MRDRFETCLLKGRIVPVMPEWETIHGMISEAGADLETARRSQQSRDAKWAIVAAYSSMVHSYRALIQVKGYQEKSDACLREAIDALYVEEGALDPALLAGFREAEFLCNQAVYDGVYSEPGARWAVSSAEAVLEAVRMLLPFE